MCDPSALDAHTHCFLRESSTQLSCSLSASVVKLLKMRKDLASSQLFALRSHEEVAAVVAATLLRSYEGEPS